jgi:hypothetical protein
MKIQTIDHLKNVFLPVFLLTFFFIAILFYSLASWEVAQAQSDLTISDALVYSPISSNSQNSIIFPSPLENPDKPQDILPGVTITETEGNTAVKEGGYNDTYTIVLDCVPDPLTSTINIEQSSESGQLQSFEPITFTKDNWNTPVTVTVEALDDSTVEGLHSDQIEFLVTATPYSNYFGILIPDISVDIYDNDPGITITETNGNTEVKEGGFDDTFTIVLNSPPDPSSATISVNLFSGYRDLQPFEPITFTQLNWSTPITVTVKAVDDTESKGVHTDTIKFFITSTPYSNYYGISVPDLNVTIYDDDYRIYLPIIIKDNEYLTDCLFGDTFNDTIHDWYIIPQVQYGTEMDGSEYILRHWRKNSTVLSTAPFESSLFTDYYSINMDSRLTESSDLKSRLGILFEFESQDTFYFFSISPETQEWWLYKVNNQWEMISSGTSNAILEDNASNQLQLIRKRSTGLIQIFANGTQLWSGIDSTHVNGKSGVLLFAKSTLQGTAEAAFDNFIIKKVE